MRDEASKSLSNLRSTRFQVAKWAILETDGKITFVPWNPEHGTGDQNETQPV